MKLKRRHAKRGRVEVIPLIDTILILLIFYMSFSTFGDTEKRIDGKMPLVSTKVSAADVPLDMVLHVHSKDNITIGAVTYTQTQLRNAMLDMGSMNEVTVVIEGDPDTQYQDIIGALDACAQAKLKKVAFRPIAPAAAGAGAAAAAVAP